jgi:beta-glucanase (GH16 family)/regulation of enolase protein 1 (concanavalin A-like superfamily)
MITISNSYDDGIVSSKTHRHHIYYFLIVLFLMITAFTSQVKAQCTTLVWQDEFDGPSLDLTKWSYVIGRGCGEPSGCGFGNGEEQGYTNQSKNVSVSGGKLNITAIFDNPEPGAAFSSGKIQTKGLKSFQYGKIEARMKLPSGQGAWPAFWTLAENNSWPFTGEIDIMEAKHKNPTQLLGTVWHYNGHTTGQITTPDLSAAFHNYAIEWEKDEIRWYFDGTLFHRANPTSTGGAWPFNNVGNPMYLMLNLAVGGLGTPFTGNQAFNSADFPTTLQVEYVRVYSGTWNVEFNGDLFVYKGETNKVYSVTSVPGASYSWTVPSGATIVSGQNTNQITINFGANAVSGNIAAAVTNNCTVNTYSKPIAVEPEFKVTTILKDWDANSNMVFKSTSGSLTQVSNPSGSGNVGRYVRNASEKYDALVYNQAVFGNASDFVTRRRRIQADIYTDAPIGTRIRFQLENAAKATQLFPVGRHSVHETVTTKRNQWETVEFEYINSPDIGTGGNTVDQLAIMFAVETNTGNTYHIDNIRIGTAGDLCPRVLNQTLEDFQNNRNITFNSSTGTLSSVANPSASGVNTSAQVGRYVRNASELYDVLFYKNVSLNNVANFKNGKSVFKMHVYTAAPVGTLISLQLETSASTPQNYPTGRHSLYQGVTTAQNQWQTIEFSFISSLDALAKDADVNSIVFLFSPGVAVGNTYYFDNLITEAENCVVVVDTTPPSVPTNLTSPSKTATSVNLSWTASTDNVGVTGYEIFVNNETTPRTTVGTTSASITGLTSNTTYAFKVRARDAAPNFSGFSTSISVTTEGNPVTLPLPWVTSDVGAVAASGSASHSSGTFTVAGSGADIWGTADEFRYVYQPVTGDVTLTARIVSLTNSNSWAKAGVMIRETTAANAKHASTIITPTNGLSFQRRAIAGGGSEHTGSGGSAPYWLRIKRVGNVFTSEISTNGSSWSTVGTQTISMTSTVQVGLAVTSHADGSLCTAIFDNVVVSTTSNVPVTGVSVTPAIVSLALGGTQSLTATVAPSNATNKNVTWSSSNTSVATVSNGLVSAVGIGNATITVTTVDGNRQATSSVSVTGASNLALNKATTTSSVENATLTGASAVDGNGSTRWSSAFSDPQWIYVDLNATYSVNRVKITWEAAYGSNYQVQISSNATSWSDLKTITGNSALVNDHTGLSGTGRYIRIYGTTRGTPYGYSIFELEVYGTLVSGARGIQDGVSILPEKSEEEMLESSIDVYPNPVIGETLTIKRDQETTIKIFNVNGLQVTGKSTDEKVDVSNLTPGVYTILLMKNNKVVQRRFTKQ